MKKLIESKYILLGVVLFIGVAIGWLISPPGNQPIGKSDDRHTNTSEKWTCSMHPQIRKDKPGRCPLCGMELIPLDSNEPEHSLASTVRLSNTEMKIAEVEMSVIKKATPRKEIYLPGKIVADERRISKLTARFSGRIEKLLVNFTGQKVRKGQVLATIYSPDLVTAQHELVEAIKFKESNSDYYEASRNKLKLWDLTNAQISKIETSRDVKYFFEILSPISGTVTIRQVALGDYVKTGEVLFEVIDLRHVWAVFDAYESDIPWIKMGDEIEFTIKSIPSQKFKSTVTFIDPVLDHMSRVAGIRAELANSKGSLKPQMLVSGRIRTTLPNAGDQLIVPKSAILWTGKKAVVYVKTGDQNNLFQFREINLGAEAGNYYLVASGLDEGEIVASNGVFKIDAVAQLMGKKSMMSPTSEQNSIERSYGPASQTPDMVNEMIRPLDDNFKNYLTEVYKSQLVMQKALIATDAQKVITTLAKVETSLKKIDATLVKSAAYNHGKTILKILNKTSSLIKATDDIEKQRLAYADFSKALYQALKTFGTNGETIYYKYCPMANNNQGAYWLNSMKEIRNPYFGNVMIACGENKEVIR